MLSRLKRLDKDHMRIVNGAMRVAFFLLIGKFAGALKEMVVAQRYGVSDVVDAYQFTLTMSNWLPLTLVGSFSIVLIPILVKLRYDSPQARHLFLRQLQGWMILIGLVIGGLTFVVWPWVIDYAAHAFSEHAKQASMSLIYAFAPAVLFTLMSGLSMSRLRARERHINTLLDSLPAVFIFIWILATPGDQSTGPLLWGTLVGYIVQSAILYVLAARADQDYSLPTLGLSSSYWKIMMSAGTMMLIGQIATSFVGPIDQMTAAHLGQNANAAMGYATRLISLIIGIGAASVGRAALPVLADIQAKGDAKRARHMSLKWSFAMLGAGVIIVIVSWILTPFIIHILFERGAFTAHDTVAVSRVMRFGLLQLPFYFGVLILVQFMASQNRYGLMSAIAVGNFAVKAIMNYIFAPMLGTEGIMLATSLMYLFSFACYFWVVYRSHVPTLQKEDHA